MGYNVVGVGMGATTSGQTSIIGNALDDAESIGIYMPTTISTGVLYSVTVCPTSSGTVFFPFMTFYSSTPQALVMTSSANVGSTTAGPFYQIEPVTFKQLRITSTAADPTFPSWIVTKHILI